MVRINLRDFYPYNKEDTYVEVSTEVADMLKSFERSEANYERKIRRYKAYYSLDHKTGIERSILFTSHSPEELYERKLTTEELHAAIAQLPDKQAKRIYAHYLLGMSKEEIARAEGVSWRAVHQSIQQGLIRTRREDSILRGCFGELKGAKMISVRWADNFPYMIDVLKDGYLYDQHMQENKSAEEVIESSFEQELNDLLDRTKQIREPTNMTTGGVSLNERNRPSAEWVNDVEIFYHKFLVEHPLGPRIKSILFHRQLSAYSELLSCLNSIKRDKAFLNTMHSGASASVERRPQQMLAEFDVFISHANNDKPIIVEDLYTSLKLLGIRIFYDKESLEWGDNWKKRILEGTSKAEFAIIVISENFFDREWTEIELREFLNRQNKNGQKLILPILHGITPNDLRQRYPSVADIQAISSADYTCDQIALLFAKQFIKRLRS